MSHIQYPKPSVYQTLLDDTESEILTQHPHTEAFKWLPWLPWLSFLMMKKELIARNVT